MSQGGLGTGGVRFAPSPTGRFHLGNLRTAWISHLWAQALRLPWVVRFEDIDRPRVLVGAQESQLADLASLGLKPDALLIQSHFHERHWQLFLTGIREGQIYPCDCSRKEVQMSLAGIASAPHGEVAPVYSGRCRHRIERERPTSETLAWRFRMPDSSGREDFVIARSSPRLDKNGEPEAEGFVPSYHWACAIDDWDGGYQLLVRASDLKSAAKLQQSIQIWLHDRETKSSQNNLYLPAVFHTSLVVQNDGHRLEKRTKGVTLSELEALGLSHEQILNKFFSSFDHNLLKTTPLSGALFGENDEHITLAKLGFS